MERDGGRWREVEGDGRAPLILAGLEFELDVGVPGVAVRLPLDPALIQPSDSGVVRQAVLEEDIFVPEEVVRDGREMEGDGREMGGKGGALGPEPGARPRSLLCVALRPRRHRQSIASRI